RSGGGVLQDRGGQGLDRFDREQDGQAEEDDDQDAEDAPRGPGRGPGGRGEPDRGPAGGGVQAEDLAFAAGRDDAGQEGAAGRLGRADEGAQDQAEDPERAGARPRGANRAIAHTLMPMSEGT